MINRLEAEYDIFHYGAINHGMVIYEMFNLAPEMKEHLTKACDYIQEIYIALLYNRPPPVNVEAAGSLLNCMAFLKHEGFREENEFRICAIPHCKEPQHNRVFGSGKEFQEIKTRSSSGILVPYIELFEKSKNLPIKAICVGPHREKELRAKSIRTYLDSLGLTNVEVFCSEIPYIGSK
jgi:hypothetical protein